MKLKSYRLLFHIFSFLSDKTNGASLFVKYKLLLGTLILGVVSTPASAQKKESPDKPVILKEGPTCYLATRDVDSVMVSGIVKDESDDFIIGATISVKGKSGSYIVSDFDGKFSLRAHPNDILVISYLGAETKEIPISKMSGTPIILKNDKTELSCYLVVMVPPIVEVFATVTDQHGVSVTGVNVMIKGTTKGVATDEDGKFRLNANPKDTLVFSYIGLKTREVPVSKISDKAIVMEEDNMILCYEVIVAPQHFYKK